MCYYDDDLEDVEEEYDDLDEDTTFTCNNPHCTLCYPRLYD